jgi:transketolase
MRDAFVNSLTSLAEQDRRIVLVTGDLGFGVLDDFRRRCPRQFLNAGVAEQNMIGVATGLALDGHVVFTYSIANFAFMRCLEQIRNDAAYHDCNVNVVAVGGGLSYGALGISHHATEDLAIMRSIPGVTVVAPGDDYEASEAASSLHARPGVGYVRLDRSGAGMNVTRNESFSLGRARVLRNGSDITLVGTGGILAEVLMAADALAEHGISCRVLSMHTLKPLDHEALLAAARSTGGIVTVEEHTVDGGLGGAVAESLLEAGVSPGVFRRIGLRCGFSSIVGSQDYLRRQYGLDRVAITDTVRAALASKVSSASWRRAA